MVNSDKKPQQRSHEEKKTPTKNQENATAEQKTLCPLAGKCLTKNVVYEAKETTNDTTQKYIGMKSCTFKTRFDQHNTSFIHKETNEQHKTK